MKNFHQVTNKSKHVVTLESKLRTVLSDEKKRKASVTELKEYIQKMEQLLEEKKGVIEKYQQNLQVDCSLMYSHILGTFIQIMLS